MKKKENEKDVNTLLIIRREKKKQALNERNCSFLPWKEKDYRENGEEEDLIGIRKLGKLTGSMEMRNGKKQKQEICTDGNVKKRPSDKEEKMATKINKDR